MSDKELPAGWAVATLEQVASWGSGGTPKAGVTHYYDGNIPWAVIGDLTDGPVAETTARITTEGLANSSAKWVPADAILIAMYGSIGKLGIAKRPLTTNQAIAFAVPNIRLVDTNYLFWYLRSQRNALLGAGKGGTQQNISQTILKSWPIPVPPLKEQRRIVEALEDHLSRLDVAQACTTGSQARLTSLSGAFRDRLIIGGNSTLPDGWRWGTLSEVLDRVEAGKSFKCEPRPATSDEWGVIKVSAMTWGEFNETEQKAVPADKEFDSRHEIQDGDILVSRANTAAYVGAPVLVRRPRPKLLLSDKSLRLVPTAGVDKTWLLHVLASPYVRSQISDRATGTKDSMRNISQRDLLSVRIPIPPRMAQREVAEAIEAQLVAAGQLASSLARAASRSSHLRKSLLARAFTGKLVPQDPADEPASELLARIQAARAAQPKPKRTRRTPAPRNAKANVTANAEAPPAPDRTTPLPPTAVQQEFEL